MCVKKNKFKKFNINNSKLKKINSKDFYIKKYPQNSNKYTKKYDFITKKIDWKKGAAELLGYGVIMPMIIALIIAILTAGQISSVKQNLAYASYSVGRAAVVSNNVESAKKRADAVMKEMYGDNFIGGTIDSNIQNDYIYKLKNGQTCYEIVAVGANAQWAKGDVIKCTIYERVVPILPFLDNIYSESLAMMIEAGGIYVGGAVDGNADI